MSSFRSTSCLTAGTAGGQGACVRVRMCVRVSMRFTPRVHDVQRSRSRGNISAVLTSFKQHQERRQGRGGAQLHRQAASPMLQCCHRPAPAHLRLP